MDSDLSYEFHRESHHIHSIPRPRICQVTRSKVLAGESLTGDEDEVGEEECVTAKYLKLSILTKSKQAASTFVLARKTLVQVLALVLVS